MGPVQPAGESARAGGGRPRVWGKSAGGGPATKHAALLPSANAAPTHLSHTSLPPFHCAHQVSNVLYEAGAGLVNVWKRPIKGAKRHGVVGAVEGAGRGLVDLGYRPAKGVVLSAEALAHMASAKAHGGRGGKDEEAAAQ